ncbi:restriction endonuclease subunit S [Helicobacter pylori]
MLISASGTIGKAVIYDGKPAYFQDSNIVWIDNDETLVKNDFLFYVYSNVKWNTEHTTILRLYNDNFRNTLIPIPPLEIQQEIVKILDQFSILTTDLLAGIPAEIEARKKQYEYYREKLLTFKPLKA